MPHAAWNKHEIAFFDLDLVAAGGLFCAPFAGRYFIRIDQSSAENQRRFAAENVIDVVRIIVDFVQIILAKRVMKNGDTRLLAGLSNDVFVRVSRLRSECFFDVDDLLLGLNDVGPRRNRRLASL